MRWNGITVIVTEVMLKAAWWNRRDGLERSVDNHPRKGTHSEVLKFAQVNTVQAS